MASSKCQKDRTEKQVRRSLHDIDFVRPTATEQGEPRGQLESEARGLTLWGKGTVPALLPATLGRGSPTIVMTFWGEKGNRVRGWRHTVWSALPWEKAQGRVWEAQHKVMNGIDKVVHKTLS